MAEKGEGKEEALPTVRPSPVSFSSPPHLPFFSLLLPSLETVTRVAGRELGPSDKVEKSLRLKKVGKEGRWRWRIACVCCGGRGETFLCALEGAKNRLLVVVVTQISRVSPPQGRKEEL